MPSFSQVVIIDELSINNDDKEKIKSGKTSKLEETLAWLADNTAMTLAALSSTFLLDKGTFGTTVSNTALDEMIARTGFIGSIQLKFIMRSSQNIAAGTSTASVNQTYTRSYKIPGTISPGSSSTVPGTRPRAWVYKHTAHFPTAFNQFRKFPQRGDICFYMAERAYKKTSLSVKSDNSGFWRFLTQK